MNLLCSEQVILNDDLDLLAATVTVTTSESSTHSASYSSSSAPHTFYAGVSTGGGGGGGALFHSTVVNNASTTTTTDIGNRLLNTAGPDPTFLDDRCLENLLKAEEKYSGRDHVSYFSGQRDITPEMRKIVAEWMMEVSFVQFCFYLYRKETFIE